MSMCERCERKGFKPQEMLIDGDKFIGPCCAVKHVLPPMSVTPSEVDAGIALTTRDGLRAYVAYEGFEIRFHKSPEELKQWLEDPTNLN